jgi:hypothetical protein
LNGRTEAEEDPPLDAEHGGASLLAEDSGGDTTPSLRKRRRENRLRNLPKLSSNLKMHHAAELLSPATTADQESKDITTTLEKTTISRGPVTEANSAVFQLERTAVAFFDDQLASRHRTESEENRRHPSAPPTASLYSFSPSPPRPLLPRTKLLTWEL